MNDCGTTGVVLRVSSDGKYIIRNEGEFKDRLYCYRCGQRLEFQVPELRHVGSDKTYTLVCACSKCRSEDGVERSIPLGVSESLPSLLSYLENTLTEEILVYYSKFNGVYTVPWNSKLRIFLRDDHAEEGPMYMLIDAIDGFISGAVRHYHNEGLFSQDIKPCWVCGSPALTFEYPQGHLNPATLALVTDVYRYSSYTFCNQCRLAASMEVSGGLHGSSWMRLKNRGVAFVRNLIYTARLQDVILDPDIVYDLPVIGEKGL